MPREAEVFTLLDIDEAFKRASGGRLPGLAAHADCRIHAHRRGFLRRLRDGTSSFRTRRGASISSLCFASGALLILVSPVLLLLQT